MSFRLMDLPPEIFLNVFEMIDKGPGFKGQHHETFVNLSLTSKTCRSYASRYVFRRLYFPECRLPIIAKSLANCVKTLERLGVCHVVQGVDVIIRQTKHMKKAERDSDVGSLKKFPSLVHLYVYIPHGNHRLLKNELDHIMADHCSQGHLICEASSWWWYV
jgi:hypothetical protein